MLRSQKNQATTVWSRVWHHPLAARGLVSVAAVVAPVAAFTANEWLAEALRQKLAELVDRAS